jgi:hypothetical protein
MKYKVAETNSSSKNVREMTSRKIGFSNNSLLCLPPLPLTKAGSETQKRPPPPVFIIAFVKSLIDNKKYYKYWHLKIMQSARLLINYLINGYNKIKS